MQFRAGVPVNLTSPVYGIPEYTPAYFAPPNILHLEYYAPHPGLRHPTFVSRVSSYEALTRDCTASGYSCTSLLTNEIRIRTEDRSLRKCHQLPIYLRRFREVTPVYHYGDYENYENYESTQ